MIRRTMAVLATTGVLIAGFAAPASAAPDGTTCTTNTPSTTTLPISTTTAQICVDVTTSDRGAWITATAPLPPTITVHYVQTVQCNTSSCSVIATDYGPGTSPWTGAYGAYAFGHTYYTCAELTVSWSVAGVTVAEYYPWICSGTRVN